MGEKTEAWRGNDARAHLPRRRWEKTRTGRLSGHGGRVRETKIEQPEERGRSRRGRRGKSGEKSAAGVGKVKKTKTPEGRQTEKWSEPAERIGKRRERPQPSEALYPRGGREINVLPECAGLGARAARLRPERGRAIIAPALYTQAALPA